MVAVSVLFPIGKSMDYSIWDVLSDFQSVIGTLAVAWDRFYTITNLSHALILVQ